MIASPFPEFVGFAVKTIDAIGDFVLSPEEADILSARAVKKRRDDFLLGRAACSTALKQIGLKDPPPILKGPSNEPIWPESYIGSITHSFGTAICAVCPDHLADGIGVDIEHIAGDVSPDVFRITCTEAEIGQIEVENQDAQLMFKRFFSAKEAAFKAFFPHAQSYIDYKEATLIWNKATSYFQGELLVDAGMAYPAGSVFTVGSSIEDDFVFSHILLPQKGSV